MLGRDWGVGDLGCVVWRDLGVMDKEVEEALFQAFLRAGETLGERLKGLPCFLHNWGDWDHPPEEEEE